MTISNNLDTFEGDVEKTQFRNEIDSVRDVAPSSSPITTSARSLTLRKFWVETWKDLRLIKWRRLFGQIGMHLLVVFVVAALLCLVIQWARPRDIYLLFSPCMPDGSFHLGTSYTYLYNPWQQDSLFTIDLGVGSMSFAVAKGVDVVWDVGFGRGGQGLLALISYRVCTKSLSRLMEKKPVTRKTFEAVTLQPVSFEALYKSVRDCTRNGSARATWTVLWIILSTSFLLSFQSISSAMTGYSARLGAYIQTDTGERVPATQFDAVQYTIHDGHRLGGDFYDDYYVVMPSSFVPSPWAYGTSVYATGNQTNMWYISVLNNFCSSFAPQHWDQSHDQMVFDWNDESRWAGYTDSVKTSCLFMWHVSEYVAQYGFLGQNNTNSTFNNSGTIISLSGPSLNISAYFDGPVTIVRGGTSDISWGNVPYGYDWQDKAGAYPFHNSTLLFAYNDLAYNLTTLESRGVCQQADVDHIRYQWGFSSALLVVFLILCLVWVIGTYAMYLDAYFNSELDLSERDINLNRAVFDLQAAMKKDLVSEHDITALGDKKLRRLLNNGHVDYRHLLSDTDRPVTRAHAVGRWRRNFNLAAWSRAEKWWILIHIVLFILFILSFVTPNVNVWYSPLMSWLPWLGSLVVLLCGRKHPSRWIWLVLSLIVTITFDLTIGIMFPLY